MIQKKESSEEEFVFEFYDEDYGESLEDEPRKIDEDYKNVNFEEDLNKEQLLFLSLC